MSSFRKRNVQKPIPGTRTSPRTGQVITSSGNLSLDALLGGGLPIGSICLIEEDKYITHSKVLAKYFLAEGVLSHQTIFLGCLDYCPRELLRKLPKPLNQYEVAKEVADAAQNGEEDAENKNGLRIAWRYNDLPMINMEQSAPSIGHYFNLLEQMHPVQMNDTNIVLWPTPDSEEEKKEYEVEAIEAEAAHTNSTIFENSKYMSILGKIHKLVREQKFLPGLGQKTLCRVCITSLGSPLWYDEHFSKDILKFLTILRALVRGSLVSCFITMPMHLIAKYDEKVVPQIRNLVDYAIELESFAGSDRETHPAFQEYSGLLHLHKISAMNALGTYMPETCDLAFKLRRKNFVIEKLHLPPELQNDNKPDAAERKPTLSCASSAVSAINSKSSLDF